GYWKTASLDDDDVASVERRLALSQLNYEIELLEPWLATGTVVARVNFTTRQPDANPINQRRLDFRTGTEGAEERDALLRARETELKRKQEMKRELEATIIRSDYGLLLLPVWYETDAQYCPGQMAANDATI